MILIRTTLLGLPVWTYRHACNMAAPGHSHHSFHSAQSRYRGPPSMVPWMASSGSPLWTTVFLVSIPVFWIYQWSPFIMEQLELVKLLMAPFQHQVSPSRCLVKRHPPNYTSARQHFLGKKRMPSFSSLMLQVLGSRVVFSLLHHQE